MSRDLVRGYTTFGPGEGVSTFGPGEGLHSFRVIYWYLGDEHVLPRLIEARTAEQARTQAKRLMACPIVSVERVS